MNERTHACRRRIDKQSRSMPVHVYKRIIEGCISINILYIHLYVYIYIHMHVCMAHIHTYLHTCYIHVTYMLHTCIHTYVHAYVGYL